MNGEKEILAGCRKGKQSAQWDLYERYSRLLLAVCNRYAKSMDEAEDILQEGFVKIFLNIKEFKGDGPLLAWMRRIMINTAITHYHKMRKHRYHDDLAEVSESRFENKDWGEAEFTEEELFSVIQQMPDGYRQVFNLYALEGYKHREIAEIMNIDENTSKSQYSRGRRWLQERLLRLKEERRKKDE
ncbi:MAG: sigma-70 family RNA polymerase sigma factor [Bacteroidales bacterium]|nr:sigma-70 family RNA polymerase sigma factor [Bacteroidales bacterium]